MCIRDRRTSDFAITLPGTVYYDRCAGHKLRSSRTRGPVYTARPWSVSPARRASWTSFSRSARSVSGGSATPVRPTPSAATSAPRSVRKNSSTATTTSDVTFPTQRPRRLRSSERLRAMVRETRLTPERLVYPLFVAPGQGVRKEISSLPGCFHLSADEAAREAREVEGLGIGGVILFGLPSAKDPEGSEGYAEDGVVQKAVRAIRSECRDLLVMTDVCLCEYTSHGHCGLVGDGAVQND